MSRASTGIASRRSASPTWPNSSTPEGTRNALNPRTPSCQEPGQLPRVAGHHAAPEARRRPGSFPAAAACLARRASRVVVAGIAVEGHVHEGRDAARPPRPGWRSRTPPTPSAPAR